MHKITYKLDNIIDDLDKYIKIIMSNIMMQDIHKKPIIIIAFLIEF